MARETPPPFEVEEGEGPLVATAIHAGHAVRDEVRDLLRLGEGERLREEDPYTGRFTRLAHTRIVVHRSRFEVDLNRPRAEAVYRKPEDAWGLGVWKDPQGPPESVVEESLALYDSFYGRVGELLEEKRRRHGAFVVYDLHSYNHRREGPDAPPADLAGNPDVNLGTGSMDRARWAPVADALMDAFSGREVMGRRLDCRENVRFTGGQFPRWVHETFPESGCAPAIELKKIFMDEWTGEPREGWLEALGDVLRGTVPPVLRALDRCRAVAG